MSAPVVAPAPSPSRDHPRDGRAALPPAAVAEDLRARLQSVALAAWPLAVVALIALLSRLRYAWWGYRDTFGSGDAHLVLTKAWYVRAGELEPSAAVGPAANIFSAPPLIPILLAAFSFVAQVSVTTAVLVVGPALTILALLALYGMASRAFDRTIALIGVSLVALLPRFSFDSTEPDKVAYVVSFSILALWLLYEGQRRAPLLLLAGACLGLAVFSHTTACLFVPVFALSHLALSWGRWRRMLSPWFLAGCAIMLGFFAVYVMLDRRYEPVLDITGTGTAAPAFDATVPDADAAPPPVTVPAAPAASEEDSGLLPGVVEDYWRNLWSLAQGGFQDSAWDLYFDGIRGQLLDPVYGLAILGFLLATGVMVARRRLEMAPLLLWMLLVTVGFAIQSPAPSHGSRYPSYVTPAFVIVAVFGLVTAARWAVARLGAQPSYALALAAPFVAWAAFSYGTAPDPGNRRLYEGHRAVAESIAAQGLLNEERELLYLGWPSYTFFLLDNGVDESLVQTFGWRAGYTSGITIDYIESHNIRYFLHDDRLDDYFGSSAQLKENLELVYRLTEVESFCTVASAEGCAGHVTLYEMTPGPALTP